MATLTSINLVGEHTIYLASLSLNHRFFVTWIIKTFRHYSYRVSIISGHIGEGP